MTDNQMENLWNWLHTGDDKIKIDIVKPLNSVIQNERGFDREIIFFFSKRKFVFSY